MALRKIVMGVILLISHSLLAGQTARNGEYVVKLDLDSPSFSKQETTNILQTAFGGKENFISQKALSEDRVFLVKVKNEVLIQKVLKNNPEISLIDPNFIIRSFSNEEVLDFDFIPSDERFTQQWGFYNTKQRLDQRYEMTRGADMKILEAWNAEPRSIDAARDIIVAVIDTGINKKHEDLKENLWKNPGEFGAWRPQSQDDVDRAPGCWDKSCNMLDDDGNGLVDDIHGWNWVKFSTENSGSSDFHDDQGHGSHCAGVIGAKHNQVGVSGINNKVQLMALKFLSKKGEGTLAGAIEAINYAVEKRADIINASWGGSQYSKILHETITRAGHSGTMFVAAAGNSSLNNDFFSSYPANLARVPGLTSVAATEFNNQRAYFSNYGRRNVHLSAPGHVIMSTVLGKRGYNYMSGTSMAAPHVSGLAAMMIGLYPEKFSRKPEALKRYLMQTSTRTTSLNWQLASGGFVNAHNAVMGIVPVGNTKPEGTSGWKTRRASFRSTHPYEPDTNQTFEIKSRGAQWMRLKFGKYSLEEGVDQVELYDAEGNLFDTLTGIGENSLSRSVKGDKIIVKFKSDSNVNDWGYEIIGVSSLSEGDR
jgi:thermitase